MFQCDLISVQNKQVYIIWDGGNKRMGNRKILSKIMGLFYGFAKKKS